MDQEVVWSPEAIEDVDSIAAFISRDSRFYAAAVVQKILDTGHDLTHFPLSGRIVPELEDESIRERIVYSYRLIYRVKGKMITIAAVLHGKRLFDSVEARLRDHQEQT